MVKFIATKRSSKNTTIEQYNEEKARLKAENPNRQNKPQQGPHRYTNIDRRHKYVRATQKLKEIDVNVAHYINEIRINPYSEEVDGIGSFFYDELENAKNMDLTREFQEFHTEIYDVTQNLALILYNLDTIVEKILIYIEKKDCRKTILQILPGLFRDAQKDIYQAFTDKLLPKLVDILNEKDIGVMGDVFKCLAYGLKYLYDQIKANFENFYSLYITRFFSSQNKHIQRFTSESLSYVLRKLKNSEIDSAIKIVMQPLLAEDSDSLLVKHIPKLLFYSIKNQQETYTSKSLNVIECVLRFVLNNQLNDAVYESILNFINEILMHTHKKTAETTAQDKFQEKINVTKLNVLEHFVNTFIHWLNNLESIHENAYKLKLLSKICVNLVIFRRGNFITSAIIKIIFNVIKELDSLYSSAAQKSHEETILSLKEYNYIVIAKLLKYQEAELLKDKTFTDFVDEKIKREIQNDRLINVFITKLVEEDDPTFAYRERLNEEESLALNYTFKRYSYDVVLTLVLKNFRWNKIISPSSYPEFHRNLYLFYVVHKYSNKNNKIFLRKEEYKLQKDTPKLVSALFEKTLLPFSQKSVQIETLDEEYFQNFTHLLLFFKYLDVFDLEAEDKKSLQTLLNSINQKIYDLVQQPATDAKTKTVIIPEKLYEIPEALHKQNGSHYIRAKQTTVNAKELLLMLKGEIISKTSFVANLFKDNNLEHTDSLLQKEFKFLCQNKTYLNYVQSFNSFIEETLKQLKATQNKSNTNKLAPYFHSAQNVTYLSLEKYGQYIELLADNLANPNNYLRRYTLEVLTKIQACNLVEKTPSGTESEQKKECDALRLCLEIENTKISLETERVKIMHFTQLRTYSDFSKLPQEYVVPLFNFYIGSLSVKMTTIWDYSKENIVSLLKLNDKRLYSIGREHIIFLNAALNPWVTYTVPVDGPVIDLENVITSGESKTLFEIFLDDYSVKAEQVTEEDIFKSLLDSFSKYSKPVEDHFNDFFAIFQNFLNQEYYKIFENEMNSLQIALSLDEITEIQNSEENLKNLLLKNSQQANKQKDSMFHKCRHFANTKLEVFLKLFTSCKSIANFHRIPAFYDLLQVFLRKGSINIQKHALDCLLKYERNEVNQHAENIKKFIKPETYRDQLTNFSFDSLTESQRKILIPIIIGILYPKLFEKKGKNKKSQLEANRTMVFMFFSSLKPEEIQHLLSIFFRNYGMPWENIENISVEALMVHLSSLNIDRITGFLETIKNLIEQLGILVFSYVPSLFKIINSSIKLCTILRGQFTSTIKTLKVQSRKGEEIEDDDEILLKLLGKWKSLYQVSIKRVIQLYTKYHDFDIQKDVTITLMETLKQNIDNLYVDSSSNVSLLLKIFGVWSKYRAYLEYFIEFKQIVPAIVKIYAQKTVKKEVVDAINTLLFNICEFIQTKKPMEIEGDNEDTQPTETLADEMDISSTQAVDIIKENVEVTISSIKTYFDNQVGASQRKVWKPNLKLTKILMSFSMFIHNDTLCDALLVLLQPLVEPTYINKAYAQRRKREGGHSAMLEKTIQTLNGVLNIFANLFKNSTKQEQFYATILDLLSDLDEHVPRGSIVKMVLHLQVEKFNLSAEATQAIKSLNKCSRMSERALDYGNIVPLCGEINQTFLENCTFEDQHLILSQYFFFLKQEELSLRMTSVAGFRRFFEIIESRLQANQDGQVPKEIPLITKTILPKLINGLKAKKEYQVKDNLEILDCYIASMNRYKAKGLIQEDVVKVPYLDLKLLQNKTDLAQDFFENIFDVQNYKRVKAITILTKKLAPAKNEAENKETEIAQNFTVTSLRDIILPVLRFQILNKSMQEDVLKASGSQITHAKVLVTNMIEAFSMCLANFSWSQYFAVLKAHVATLSREQRYEKVVVRLLCANLNYLDAGLPNIVEQVTQEMKAQATVLQQEGLMNKLVNYNQTENRVVEDPLDVAAPTEEKKISMEIESTGAVQPKTVLKAFDKNTHDEKMLQITSQLRKRILMPLKKHMHDLAAQENKEKKIRVYTAIAIAKVSCRMPYKIFNVEYPRLIHNMCESLRSRDFDIRTNARKALTEIVAITGPYFFHYIVNEMKSVLTLGYQQHIKNYTLYYLLQSMIHPKANSETKEVEIGSLDYCLPNILPVFVEEILGHLQEEKQVAEIKNKIPEFKTSKAYEAFQLLSSVINIKQTFIYLVNFIKSELVESSSSLKKCNKIEDILRNIVDGVSKNPAIDIEFILIICFYLIEQALETMMIKDTPNLSEFTMQEYSISKEDLKTYDTQKTFLIQEGAASGKSIFKAMQQNEKKNNFIVGKVLSSFSLNLIQICIKKSQISRNPHGDHGKHAGFLSKFEPLTQVIVNCLKSKENAIITGSIKILNSVATWPLTSLKQNYQKIVASVLKVLESLSLTDYDMIRACFKLIANISNIPAVLQLSNQQVKILLQFIEQFMFISDNITEVLDCLAVLIQKKTIRPEVYDLVDKILESMITNENDNIQRSCKNVFAHFVVEYPMTDKLLKKYIQLFIKNLDYVGDQGRAMSLETLERMVEILPVDLLANYFDIILYSTVIKTISEKNLKIKGHLRKVGATILKKVPENKFNEYTQNFISWLEDRKEGVVQSGLEGFILIMRTGNRIEKHTKTLLHKVDQHLIGLVEKINLHWQETKEEVKRVKEQNTIESKILKRLKEDNANDEKVSIENYESLCECLIRVVQAFSENYQEYFSRYLTVENPEFFQRLLILITFPKEVLIVDCLGVLQILIQNLANNLSSIFENAEAVLDKLGAKLINMFKLSFATNDFETKLSETIFKTYSLAQGAEVEYTTLLLIKIRKVLLRMMASANQNSYKIKRIVNFVYTMEKKFLEKKVFTKEVISAFVEIILRVENIQDLFIGDDDISGMLNEVLEDLKRKCETSEFIQIYSGVKVQLTQLKQERKRKAKEEVLTDPEKALKDKLRRKLKKKEASKGVFGAKGQKFKKIKSDNL